VALHSLTVRTLAKATAKATISAARAAAFRILREVEDGRMHSDDLLRTRAVNRLSAVDRNLATALVLGVLRWQIWLDHEVKQLLAKPNAKLDPPIRIALRMGALQLLRMERIPVRAAIDESVELTKSSGHHFASRMVNAVLRKLAVKVEKGSASGHDFSRAEDATKQDGASAPAARNAAELALATAHPAWLVERWVAHFGLDQALALCTHGQSQSALNLRLADPAAEAELASEGVTLAPGSLLSAARTVVSGDATATHAFREGRIRMQDEGSQLVAELAAVCTAPNRKIEKIGDVCAAPGGKTLILAERFPQAKIVACEASETRAEQLAKRLAILSPRVVCHIVDASTLGAGEAFDLVLADVPCSGTGTLGRNPEIRHRLTPDDFARQAERQRAILAAALHALAPGGRLIYSTCSLEPEENELVVAAVLAEDSSARQISLAEAIHTLDARGLLAAGALERLRNSLTAEGALRLLPGAMPTDGFFVALIERVG
jgi:16S rRNA (cytosine967-C5)-methyltransferase